MELANRMLEYATISEEVKSGELPRIDDPERAEELLSLLESIHSQLTELEKQRKASPAPARRKKSDPPHGDWLFHLLRHADNEEARKVVNNVRVLVNRLEELQSHWQRQAGRVDIQVPEQLLKQIEEPHSPPEGLKLSDPEDPKKLAELDELVLGAGQNEFAMWVGRKAHPDQIAWYDMQTRMQKVGKGSTLEANLNAVRLSGKPPSSAIEWEEVEKLLVLRACVARLREQWTLMGTLATGTPDLPATPAKPAGGFSLQVGPAISLSRIVVASYRKPLEVCVEAMGLAKTLNTVAVKALGYSLDAVRAATAGPAECQQQLERVRRSLRTARPGSTARPGHRDLGKALDDRLQLFNELGSPEEVGPLGVLQKAVHDLGSLQISPEELTNSWHKAKLALRKARHSLGHVNTLRARARSGLPHGWARHVCEVRGDGSSIDGRMLDPCPRDARKLWAAIAARKAMREDHQALAGTDRGAPGAAQRLLSQRHAVVETLVAAVAKHALREAMSAETCAGLVRLVSAVAAAGSSRGDGERADRYRGDLTAAMNDCASAVPCWIMPTWRIAQCLPAEVGSFDLVVLDEASQSDVTALSALLRGKHVLVVGDQKQVSPTAAFISEAVIRDLKRSLLASRHPYVEQLLPGRSIFDLAQTCYADARVALSQHFRCVPGCIAFSNEQFYHGRLQPRRLPPQSERLEPCTIDVLVRNGKKTGKTNPIEAQALVDYLQTELSEGTELSWRGSTVGIVSLMGTEQTRVLRRKVLESLTDAQLARHRIVVGDPSSFQGDERDVILLSMVASKGASPAQVGRMYEQRFNVALSR